MREKCRTRKRRTKIAGWNMQDHGYKISYLITMCRTDLAFPENVVYICKICCSYSENQYFDAHRCMHYAI